MRCTAPTLLIISVLFPIALAGCGTVPEPTPDGGAQGDGGTTIPDGGNHNNLDQTVTIEVLGIGGGTVRSGDGLVNHRRQVSSYTFPYRSEVTLTAAADTDSVFSAWQGDCSGVGACTLAMTDRRAVKALFNMAGAWSQAYGGAGTNEVNGLVVDGSGNLTLVGRVPAAGTLAGNPFPGGAFMLQLSATGTFRWSKSFPANVSSIHAIARAPANGQLVIAGAFTDTIDLGGGNLVSAGETDIFVASYDAAGVHQWSRRYGGATADVPATIAVDSGDRTFLSGTTGSAGIDFGSGEIGSAKGAFEAWLDPDGSELYSIDLRRPLRIAFDPSGNVIRYGKGVDLSGGSMFIGKLQLDLTPIWSENNDSGYGSSGVNAIAQDASGAIFAVGEFKGRVSILGPENQNSSSNQNFDAYLLKLTSSGTRVWSKRLGDVLGDESATGVAIDASGNLIVAGIFNSSLFDPGGGVIRPFRPGSEPPLRQDLWLAKFSSTGEHLWSRALGGDDEDLTRAFVLSPQGEAILAGTFKQTVGFGDAFRTATGTQDIFLLSAPLGR